LGIIRALFLILPQRIFVCQLSIDRLFRFLNALGSDVEIRVIAKPESDAQANTRVVAI